MIRQALCLALLVAPAALAGAPETADIVVIGEVHDNPSAHQGQADMVRKIRPKAVVFEMLGPADAARADADRAALPAIWEALPWPDYAIYEPIFIALGEAAIVGAAVPRDEIRDVFERGAAAVFGPEAARFGLDQALAAEEQNAREELQFRAHCEAMPREMMAGMVEVQRFRDARFASAAIEALGTYGPPVVVITGNGHARTDWGVPAYIETAAPDLATFSVAFAEGEEAAPFDQLKTVTAAQRPDPCAAFNSD